MTKSWDDLVILCGNTRWQDNPLAARNLAIEMTRYAPVLYVDPPVSSFTLLKSRGAREAMPRPRLRVAQERLAVLTPIGPPGKDRRGVSSVTGALVRRDLRTAVRRLEATVRAVIAIAPDSFPFGVCGERYKVYWVHDDYSAAPELLGMSGNLLARGEARLGAAADLIVVCSEPLYERWSGGPARTVLVPNGCDDRLFASARTAARPHDLALDDPLSCFVGRVTPRVDLSMLEAVVDRGLSLVVIGAVDERFQQERVTRLLSHPRVQWLGERPYASIPDYLGAVVVGLVPYADTAFNRSSYPLKTLEYLAAGIGVVSTDLPASRSLPSDLVTRARTPAEFAAGVEAAMQPVDPVAAARRMSYAADHSWRVRVAQFAAALSFAPERGGVPSV
jgi:glycosyltransferase involved in cell wall biosynthesis